MKKIFTPILLVCFMYASQAQQSFTNNNLVVYRVGDGSAALTNGATAVFLDEYSTTGTLVQSIPLPTTISGNNKRIVATGNSTSEGLISRSANGLYLMVSGYDAALGTTGLTALTSAVANRVVGRVAINGTIDATTALSDFASANTFRGVTSTDGNDIWVSGVGTGVNYTYIGNTTSTQLSTAPVNTRDVTIVNGQLYVSTNSGTAVRIGTVGSGTPMSGGQTITNLPGFPITGGSPYQFFFEDMSTAVSGIDVLYVADDAAGTIQKYSLVSGTWVANGTVTIPGNASTLRGLAGRINGTALEMYATNGTTLYKEVDNSGYNGTITGTPALIATAATNTAFRGLAFAPSVIALPVDLLSFTASPVNGTVQLSWHTANEVNTKVFAIERSNDAAMFNAIGETAAHGNGTANSYAFTDAEPLKGKSYYRLKMTDNDGAYTYSQVVIIDNAIASLNLSIYPNPVVNTVTASYLPVGDHAMITITTMDGRTIQTVPVPAGQNQSVLNVSNLVHGVYVITLTNNGNSTHQSFIK